MSFRYDEKFCTWKRSADGKTATARFYVIVGTLEGVQEKALTEHMPRMEFDFTVPLSRVHENFMRPNWHTDAVRMFLRSQLHKRGYAFYETYNLAVKR